MFGKARTHSAQLPPRGLREGRGPGPALGTALALPEHAERAFAEALQVARDMLINDRKLSELVALEAALQQQLRHLRTDAG